jgi:hypothetical protein
MSPTEPNTTASARKQYIHQQLSHSSRQVKHTVLRCRDYDTYVPAISGLQVACLSEILEGALHA